MAAEQAIKRHECQSAEIVADLAAVAPPDSSAYFFDVDGTLLELRRRPEEVVADEHLRGLLTRLQAAGGGAVARASARVVAPLASRGRGCGCVRQRPVDCRSRSDFRSAEPAGRRPARRRYPLSRLLASGRARRSHGWGAPAGRGLHRFTRGYLA